MCIFGCRLDFGKGKNVLEENLITKRFNVSKVDKYCVKSRFDSKHVVYFNKEQRLKHEVYLRPSQDVSQFLVYHIKCDALLLTHHIRGLN